MMLKRFPCCLTHRRKFSGRWFTRNAFWSPSSPSWGYAFRHTDLGKRRGRSCLKIVRSFLASYTYKKYASHIRFRAQHRMETGFFRRWFPVALLTNGVFILRHGGIELTTRASWGNSPVVTMLKNTLTRTLCFFKGIPPACFALVFVLMLFVILYHVFMRSANSSSTLTATVLNVLKHQKV